MYKVTRLPSDDEKRDGIGAEMLVVHWIDPPLKRPAARVTFNLTGGVGVGVVARDGHIWMYADEARAVQNAIGMALKEYRKRNRRRPTQKEVDEFVGDFASTLTLNRNAADKFIKTAEWRKRDAGGVEVNYNGNWLHLCRTDLKDDVRTWTSAASHGDCNSLEFYRKTVAYGARITDDAFFIVDAFSDG